MSEIKFACPSCSQHIACDAGYCDLQMIECPSCGKPLVVPRLTASDSAHPGALVIASTPGSRPRIPPPVTPLDLWTRESWAQHVDEVTGETPETSPLWLVSLCGTILVAYLLKL